jgi:hypothetical protein
MASTEGTTRKSPSTDRTHTTVDRRRPRPALTGVCTLLLLGFSQATAGTLDPANVSGSIFFNISPPARLDFNTFETFAQTGPGGFVQFTASGIPGPFLSGEATISKDFTGRASGSLIYSIEILGPAGNVPVLIDVSGGASGSSTANDPFAAFALKSLWRLEDVNLGLQTVFSEGIDTGQLSGIFNESFSHTVDLTLTANHVYRVTMVADAFAAAGSSGTSAFATAFIDPRFSFGSGVGREYSFLLSDGIGNSALVAEPSSFVLLIAGMLTLGLFRKPTMWSRRAQPSATET